MTTLTWPRKQVPVWINCGRCSSDSISVYQLLCNMLSVLLQLCTVFVSLTWNPVSGQNALEDAGIPYSAVEQACVGYVYGKTSLSSSHQNAFIPCSRINVQVLLCSIRGLHMWTEGHLPQPGPNGDPHHQRQQQLLHRLHGSVHGSADSSGWWVAWWSRKQPGLVTVNWNLELSLLW